MELQNFDFHYLLNYDKIIRASGQNPVLNFIERMKLHKKIADPDYPLTNKFVKKLEYLFYKAQRTGFKQSIIQIDNASRELAIVDGKRILLNVDNAKKILTYV